jgi:transposase
MANILHLPDWNVLKVKETPEARWIEAEPTYTPDHCPACGTVPNFYGHGTKEQAFRDLPNLGKASSIVVKRKRFRCRDCQATFLQPLKEMAEDRQMTLRLVEWIKRESVKRTFADVAREVGVDEKTIRNLFHEHVEELAKQFDPVKPKWVGMDEIHLIRKPRAIITNLEMRTVVEMLPDRDKASLETYFAKWDYPTRSRVELVAMDMWKPYRDVARKAFPNAVLVVDKFHVVKTANYCMDVIRKEVKGELLPADKRSLRRDRFILLKRPKELTMKEQLFMDMWLASFPDLGEAYRLKEEFFAVYDSMTRSIAEARYEAWLASIPAGKVKTAFKPLTTLMRNWRKEIFEYFDHRQTNAPTEALNGLVRHAHQAGRGYSFEAIRAKMLFRENVRLRKKPPRMPPMDAMNTWGMMSVEELNRRGLGEKRPAPEQLWLDFGAEISTLTDLLERGEL